MIAFIKTQPLYIHQIEINGSPKFERELEKILAQMYVNMKMDSKSQMQDPKSINVFITERRINVKCHNAW